MNIRRFFRRIFLNIKSDEIKLLVYYRYLSLAIISIFYLIGKSNHPYKIKIFIIVCISISAYILNYLYIKNESDKQKIKLLIFIETIGNTFILIPSGGINSPYIWYMLNTIILAGIKINKKYCFINISAYIFFSLTVALLTKNIGMYDIIHNSISKSNISLIMGFALITMAIMYLSTLIKDLKMKSESLITANIRLELANKKIKESMAHIKSLYQTVHTLSNYRTEKELIELFIHYAGVITKGDKVFFMNVIEHKNEMILERKEQYLLNEEKLREEILKNWNNITEKKIPIKIDVEGKNYIVAMVESSYKIYGVLGIEEAPYKEEFIHQENIQQVQFLAELGSIVLERPYIEKVNERLIVSQEQNRIANEIHDSVLQRLFSISFCIYNLIKNVENLNDKQLVNELNMIRNSMNNTMKDLRTTIYGLSSQKSGHNTLNEDILKYIDEVKGLNNIEIIYEFDGNISGVSIDHKRALYRIICEGISNAIRHGKSSKVKAILQVLESSIILEIIDNGVGFEVKEVQTLGQKGLGLQNIEDLASSLRGGVNIISKAGNGTIIKVTLPRTIPAMLKEEAV